jgi:hypothetical protein
MYLIIVTYISHYLYFSPLPHYLIVIYHPLWLILHSTHLMAFLVSMIVLYGELYPFSEIISHGSTISSLEDRYTLLFLFGAILGAIDPGLEYQIQSRVAVEGM